jgi:hypothetical protein
MKFPLESAMALRDFIRGDIESALETQSMEVVSFRVRGL